MTPMRSVYPCWYLHELNFYFTSVQRRIAPSHSPKQLIVSSLSKQDRHSDSSSSLSSSTSLSEYYEFFLPCCGWNYSLLGAVTPTRRSSPVHWLLVQDPTSGIASSWLYIPGADPWLAFVR